MSLLVGLALVLPIADSVRILQISDIHVSYNHKNSAENLKMFCENDFPRIAAEVDMVVLSGDLVDATPPFYSTTQRGQLTEDWKLLTEALGPCLKVETPIFSTRGNHDAFGVEEFLSESNAEYRKLYTTLAKRRSELTTPVQLQKDKDGNQLIVKMNGATLDLVIMLDSAPTEGVARHLYAYFPETVKSWLDEEIAKLVISETNFASKTCISHYPIGNYHDQTRLLEFLARHKVGAFHAGHVHTIFGRPTRVHWEANDSPLKLVEHEVADFKATQIIRLIDTDNSSVFDLKPNTLESVSEDETGVKHSLVLPQGPRGTKQDTGHSTLVTKYADLDMFRGSLFKHFKSFFNATAIIYHAMLVLVTLLVLLKHKTGFNSFNYFFVLFLPVLPLCLTQVFPSSAGLNFWWGGLGWKFGEPDIATNDSAAIDIFLLDTKIFIALVFLAAYGKFNSVLIRIAGFVIITAATAAGVFLNMYRAGLLALGSLTLLWDLLFWSVSPMGLKK